MCSSIQSNMSSTVQEPVLSNAIHPQNLSQLPSSPVSPIRESKREKIQWKNSPAKPNEAYQPTVIEQVANIFTHGICILPAVYATWTLTERAANPTQYWAGLIYGLALILLFTISTAFHTTCLCNKNKLRHVLHRGDRAMIYIFIASSYFPWLSLAPKSPSLMSAKSSSSYLLPMVLSLLGIDSILAADLRWFVWFLAAMGILYQHIFHEKYKWLETLIYVVIGLLPSLPFIHGDDFPGVWELKVGGACYIIGLIFFKLDGRVPLAHAIWHLHVAAGASIHYYGVFIHLMG